MTEQNRPVDAQSDSDSAGAQQWTLVTDNTQRNFTTRASNPRPAASAASDAGQSRTLSISDLESFQLCFSDTTNSEVHSANSDSGNNNNNNNGSNSPPRKNVTVESGMVVCIRGLRKVAWLNGELARVVAVDDVHCKIVFLRDDLARQTDSQPHFIDLKNVEPFGEIDHHKSGITSYVSKLGQNIGSFFSKKEEETNKGDEKAQNPKPSDTASTSLNKLVQPKDVSVSTVTDSNTESNKDKTGTQGGTVNSSTVTAQGTSSQSSQSKSDHNASQQRDSLSSLAASSSVSNSNSNSATQYQQSQTNYNNSTQTNSISNSNKNTSKKVSVQPPSIKEETPSEVAPSPAPAAAAATTASSGQKSFFSRGFTSSAHYVFSPPGASGSTVLQNPENQNQEGETQGNKNNDNKDNSSSQSQSQTVTQSQSSKQQSKQSSESASSPSISNIRKIGSGSEPSSPITSSSQPGEIQKKGQNHNVTSSSTTNSNTNTNRNTTTTNSNSNSNLKNRSSQSQSQSDNLGDDFVPRFSFSALGSVVKTEDMLSAASSFLNSMFSEPQAQQQSQTVSSNSTAVSSGSQSKSQKVKAQSGSDSQAKKKSYTESSSVLSNSTVMVNANDAKISAKDGNSNSKTVNTGECENISTDKTKDAAGVNSAKTWCKGKTGRIVGLRKIPKLNGEAATIVNERDKGHWEVNVKNFIAVVSKKNFEFDGE